MAEEGVSCEGETKEAVDYFCGRSPVAMKGFLVAVRVVIKVFELNSLNDISRKLRLPKASLGT